MMQRINDGFEFKMRSIMMGTRMRLAESCEFENSMQRIVMGSSIHTQCVVSYNNVASLQ